MWLPTPFRHIYSIDVGIRDFSIYNVLILVAGLLLNYELIFSTSLSAS